VTEANIRELIWERTDDQTWREVRDQVENWVRGAVLFRISSRVKAQTSQIRSQIQDEIEESWPS
jgi:hypothetical protein